MSSVHLTDARLLCGVASVDVSGSYNKRESAGYDVAGPIGCWLARRLARQQGSLSPLVVAAGLAATTL